MKIEVKFLQEGRSMDDEQEKLIVPTKEIKNDLPQSLMLSGVKLSNTVLGRGSYTQRYMKRNTRRLGALLNK